MDSISKSSKSRNKKLLSFREFEGSTNDAWEDIDDDIIKHSSSPNTEPDFTSKSHRQLPQVRIFHLYVHLIFSHVNESS